jgi:hypothetical protein
MPPGMYDVKSTSSPVCNTMEWPPKESRKEAAPSPNGLGIEKAAIFELKSEHSKSKLRAVL